MRALTSRLSSDWSQRPLLSDWSSISSSDEITITALLLAELFSPFDWLLLPPADSDWAEKDDFKNDSN